MADKQSSKIDIDIREETTTLPSPSTSTSSSSKLPRLRVLSLFDGIGTGYFALDKLGFDIEKFYASEINKDALMITRYHFADNIHQLGTVIDISKEMLDQIGPINLLIGGSPCSDLSSVNHRKKGIFDPNGTGILFFDYCRIWDYLKVKSARENLPFYWLYENVASMETKNQECISGHFECQPIIIDSLHVSPQRRKRYFWTNIPGVAQLSCFWDVDHFGPNEPKLEDYLEKNLDRQANVEKIGTITSKRSCLQDGKSKNPVSQDGEYSGVFIKEIEFIFGIPLHFTDVGDLSIAARQKVLGRAWSVTVIKKILNQLTDIFAKKDLQQ